MKNFSVRVQGPDNTEVNVPIEEPPDLCPRCNRSVQALYKLGFIDGDSIQEVSTHGSTCRVEAVYQCPRNDCRRYFIATFEGQFFPGNSNPPSKLALASLSPQEFQEVPFPEHIKKVSPMFCQIYNEAAQAESMRLRSAAGPTYRKALEFLVKDYLIALIPDSSEAKVQEAEKIKKGWLDALIKAKVEDQNVKNCAARATWLGNDETHYLRKWIDKDINDLKTLIKLTVNWMENYFLMNDFTKSMDDGKK